MNLRILMIVAFVGLITVWPVVMLSTGKLDPVEYLIKYKYVKRGATDAQIQEGTRVFQRKFNLTVTGTFTQETRNIMKAARCGFPDVIPQEYSVYHKKWAKKALTYTIESYTTQISQDQQRSEFKRAFDEWARHTQLSFTEVSGTADLKINFYKKAHGDGSDFDDKNGVLAHAFYPTDGRIHFDDDEEWGVNASSKKDLYGVMLHEIGHSLGIKHSDISNAVMFPMYSGYIKDLRLHADDVAAIQESYSLKVTGTDCKFDYDAVMTKGGQMYGFKGPKMVTIDNKGTPTGPETDITASYSGVTGVDEATFHQATDTVYMFKGRTAHIFKGSTKVYGGYFMYPVRFAYGEGNLLQFFMASDFNVTFDAARPTVLQLGRHPSDIPLAAVNTATSTSSGSVYFYSNTKQYTMTNNVLTAFCPA